MGLKTVVLPVCDSCGEVFLPRKGPARDDPRAYNLLTVTDPSLPRMRCGKCKSFGWDSAYIKTTLGDRRRKNPLANFTPDAAIEEPEEPVLAGPVTHETARCRHRLYDCSICHPKGRL